jgi:uncharacterized protein (DUF433 family)
MTQIETPQPTVVRTSRGLSIAGRRLTLYSLMDYLQAGWPPHLIRDEFNLTDTQMTDVMTYIEAHCDAVEQEYRVVVERAEENNIGTRGIVNVSSAWHIRLPNQGKKSCVPS